MKVQKFECEVCGKRSSEVWYDEDTDLATCDSCLKDKDKEEKADSLFILAYASPIVLKSWAYTFKTLDEAIQRMNDVEAAFGAEEAILRVIEVPADYTQPAKEVAILRLG